MSHAGENPSDYVTQSAFNVESPDHWIFAVKMWNDLTGALQFIFNQRFSPGTAMMSTLMASIATVGLAQHT